MSRRKLIGFLVGFALAAAGGAIAAIVIFSGVNGSGVSGSITITSTTQAALTFQVNGAVAGLDGGSFVNIPVKLVNNDPSASHKWTAVGTVTVADNEQPATCSSHLSVDSAGLFSTFGNITVPVGTAGVTGTLKVSLDATTPISCNGTSYTVTFSGGTTT
jgi:hypothetical protein